MSTVDTEDIFLVYPKVGQLPLDHCNLYKYPVCIHFQIICFLTRFCLKPLPKTNPVVLFKPLLINIHIDHHQYHRLGFIVHPNITIVILGRQLVILSRARQKQICSALSDFFLFELLNAVNISTITLSLTDMFKSHVGDIFKTENCWLDSIAKYVEEISQRETSVNEFLSKVDFGDTFVTMIVTMF